MHIDRLPPMLGRSTEFTVPESHATLMLQQRALLEGRRAVQMFPNGTDELPLPDGLLRLTTPRGVFHYNPEAITWPQIAAASELGRENLILGLGPYSKADVVETGERLFAVVERAPDGTEVLASLTTPTWAGEVLIEMKSHAAPGHAVVVETAELVIRDRLAARGK